MDHLGFMKDVGSVPFVASRFENGKSIWVNDNGSTINPDSFCKKYSYLSVQNNVHPIDPYSEAKSLVMFAEPYGGFGVGGNGGGSRCGNIDDVQIKGVGANPLVGDHDNVEHSYGGLDIRKAAIEAVYSVVLGDVLAKGVVNVRGLIFVGSDTARAGKQKVWGGLMVRDQCIRPGHFMRSPYFNPRKEARTLVKSDLVRVRLLYKEMAREFESDRSEFIKWLGRHLRDVANQFAFARVMRVTHGTMTASNIAWDGKWLDLPACSFLTGGVNYSIWSQFYEEHNMALSYALEILHNYSKYNRVALNPAPLVSYFYEQFQEYAKYYVGYALGLNLGYVLDLPKDSWNQVAETFLRVVHSGKKIDPRRPSYDAKDPVRSLTVAFFMAHSGSNSFETYARKSGLDEAEMNGFRRCSTDVIKAYLEIIDRRKSKSFSLFIASFLVAMKRALLPEMWYLPNVEGQVTKICSQGTPEEIGPYIDKHKEVAEWVFEGFSDSVTLWREGSQSAFYQVSEAKYAFSDGHKVRYFESYDQVYCHTLQHMTGSSPVIYDFSAFLERLGAIISDLNHTSADKVADEVAYV